MAAVSALAERLRPACAALAMLVSILLAPQPASAQNAERGSSVERQVKAAYLYRFAGFVEWPDGVFVRPDAALVIGVAGSDNMAEELERSASGQNVGGRPIVVRRLRRADPLTGVHILFAGQADKGWQADLVAASRHQPVLTVTESEDAFALGSVLNFTLVDQKVRFEVALKAAALGHLKISARMLSAAYRVVPGAP